MSNKNEGTSNNIGAERKYKGIRCRKWGKWVSEIRVPGTQDRLWLGSYATPEGAAVAHDVAFFCLRPGSTWDSFNFPHLLPVNTLKPDMLPGEIQKAASDAGMAVDASSREHDYRHEGNAGLNVSVEDYL